MDTDALHTFLLTLAEKLGVPERHSNQVDSIWDVCVQPESTARSHSDKEFEWHTDSSFEVVPPRWVILYTIQGDELGGGVLQVASVSEVLARLSLDVIEALKLPVFHIERPAEFSKKDVDETNNVALVSADGRYMRYRSDLMHSDNMVATQAVLQLREVVKQVKPEVEISMQRGTLVIVDNWRMLHARTSIRDTRRWLKRLRIRQDE
jgi:alpha-ketoglutarate-dependent taurine dioxygenase